MPDTVNHESLTSTDGKLNFLLPVGSSELDSNHLTSLFTANPFDTLELRVDQKRITTAGHYDSGVLNRNSISWEPFRGPRSLLGRRGKNCQRVNSIREWNLQILHIGNPSLSPEHVSELEREGSDVGHERGRDQSISDHRQLLILVGDNVSLPSDVFISKTIDETVSQIKGLLEICSLSDDSRFLSFSLSELSFKEVHLCNNFGDAFLYNAKLFTFLRS